MEHEFDDSAARELKAELRRLADTILDLEARGHLLTDAAALLKALGEARSRLFAWEVRRARPRAEAAAPSAEPPESARVVDEALQREAEAAQEWLKSWEHRGDGEL